MATTTRLPIARPATQESIPLSLFRWTTYDRRLQDRSRNLEFRRLSRISISHDWGHQKTVSHSNRYAFGEVIFRDALVRARRDPDPNRSMQTTDIKNGSPWLVWGNASNQLG